MRDKLPVGRRADRVSYPMGYEYELAGCETCGDSYLERTEPITSSKVTMALLDVFGIERNF
jgi:hypothetical protein